MADLTVTPGSCLQGAGALTENGIAGETITAGQALYKAADGTYMKADADSATALARAVTAIALNGASVNQPITVMRPGGDITLGATMTAGVTYYLSGSPGGICPVADVGTGEYFSIVGVAKSTTVLRFQPAYSGVSA